MADHEGDSHDQNYDENELQEIMNEIESLEREVSSSAASGEQNESEQQEGGQGIESQVNEDTENSEPHLTEVSSSEEDPAIDFSEEELQALEDDDHHEQEEENVSSFKKPRGADPSSPSRGQTPVEFHAHGDMGLELSFQIGEENARLTIENEHGQQGLRVRMSGVDLHLDAENGCRVEMEGGVHFNVPIPSQSKKKAS